MNIEPKIIDISKTKKFGIYPKEEEIRIKAARTEKLVIAMLAFAAISIIAGIHYRNKSWDKNLRAQHSELDRLTIEYNQLCRNADKNQNYKNPKFKKQFFSIRDEYQKVKKEHIFLQTNRIFTLIKKGHGECPSCREDEERLHGRFR